MRGWYNQNWRHAMSARGISTGRYAFAKRYKLHGRVLASTRHGIPITLREQAEHGRKYPVDVKDVKKTFDKLPAEDVKGLKEINMRNPGIPATKQDKAWAQFVRSEKRINLFSQPFKNGLFVDAEPHNRTPEAARKHFINYVMKHEAGHHVAAKRDNTLPIGLEESYANGYVDGYLPENIPREALASYINENMANFGPKGQI